MTSKQIQILIAVLTALAVIIAAFSYYKNSSTTIQQSAGDNSPNVSDVGGNVILNKESNE